MTRLLLLTGASGALGRMLAPRLARKGYALRLSDIHPFPDPLPEGAEFVQVDLVDEPGVQELVRGTDGIVEGESLTQIHRVVWLVGPGEVAHDAAYTHEAGVLREPGQLAEP